MKYSFKNDYSEGCHPSILEALMRTNFSQQNGYGLDDYCAEAEKLILQKANAPQFQSSFCKWRHSSEFIGDFSNSKTSRKCGFCNYWSYFHQ